MGSEPKLRPRPLGLLFSIIIGVIVLTITSAACGSEDHGDDAAQPVAPQSPGVAEIATRFAAPPTPEPTEPPIQGPFELTSAECEYLAELLPLHFDGTNALTELLELFAETRLSSDAWALSVTVRLAIISVTYERVSALDPPASLQVVHDEMYLEGLSNLNDATFLIVDGVGFRDTNLLRDATDLLLEGGEDISQAILQFEVYEKLSSSPCP